MKNATPERLRAAASKAARDAAEYEKPLLDEAAGILADMAALTDRLEAIAPQLVTAFLPIHLTALAEDRRRADAAMTTARAALDAALVD